MRRKFGSILLVSLLLIITGCGNMDNSTEAKDNLVNGKQELLTTLEVQNESSETHFVLTLENQLDQELGLTFMSGKQYEIKVYNESMDLIYNSSEGKMYTQAINELKLMPGETKQWVDVWNEKLPSGAYTIEAKITASEVNPADVQPSALTVKKSIHID